MTLFYNLSIKLLGFFFYVASFFNAKARKWRLGRRDWRNIYASYKLENKPVFWMHCASLGEFEQGRPILEAFARHKPDHFIVLSFFSPSGYEIRKDYEWADSVYYLPLDTKRNAVDFVKIINPQIAVFVKYELWLNTLNAAIDHGARVYLVSAIFREKHAVFSSIYKNLYQSTLKKLSFIFVQNQESKRLLSTVDIASLVAGDSRFDRVRALRIDPFDHIEVLQQFKGEDLLLIVGSSWPLEESWILRWLKEFSTSALKILIAPHDLNQERIDSFINNHPTRSMRFSKWTTDSADVQVLILDAMGILSHAYFYGDLAVVGGGFNKSGVHNTLEPATYALPILVGPYYKKFKEAVDLQDLGALTSVKDYNGFKDWLNLLIYNKEERLRRGEAAEKYVNDAPNTTNEVLKVILEDMTE